MDANKVIMLGLNIEKTGHWGYSFYHFAKCRLAGGWLVGKKKSTSLRLATYQKDEHLPCTTDEIDGQKDRHDEGRVAFWNFANKS